MTTDVRTAVANGGRADVARTPSTCEHFGSDKQPVRALVCTMRYFFHLEDGCCILDPKGTDFDDDAAALHEAKKVADDLSRLPVHQHDWCVVVKSANGLRVGSVPLTPSLEISFDGYPRSIQ
jgi:hypothetical protein